MSEQPGQPPAEPVPAGEPVTIQPADQPPVQQAEQPDYVEQPDGEMTGQPDPAATGVVTPPAGGPGDQSLAEQQAGGASVTADVPQPEAGPGASSPYAQPAASYPAETVTDDKSGQPYSPPVGNATSNESPMLPGNLTSGAARAHAALSTAGDVQGNGEMSESERLSALGRIIDFALTELDRFLPTHVRGPARDEVNREL